MERGLGRGQPTPPSSTEGGQAEVIVAAPVRCTAGGGAAGEGDVLLQLVGRDRVHKNVS